MVHQHRDNGKPPVAPSPQKRLGALFTPNINAPAADEHWRRRRHLAERARAPDGSAADVARYRLRERRQRIIAAIAVLTCGGVGFVAGITHDVVFDGTMFLLGTLALAFVLLRRAIALSDE